MKQTVTIQGKLNLSQGYDFTDVQSFAAFAESIALKLIEKYNGDIEKIKEAVETEDIGSFKGVSDVELADEVLWAATSIIKTRAAANVIKITEV